MRGIDLVRLHPCNLAKELSLFFLAHALLTHSRGLVSSLRYKRPLPAAFGHWPRSHPKTLLQRQFLRHR
jgi:hypothetical protein